MNVSELLLDEAERVREAVLDVLDGISPATLADRIDGRSNHITWLVWHLTRVLDDHMAAVAGTEQVWTANGWAARFALPFDLHEHGYGHTEEQVGAVTAGVDDLRGYFEDAHAATVSFLRGLTDPELDRVVDDQWDPPVTLGVRLVSVLVDTLQHAGQASYARGLIERRRG